MRRLQRPAPPGNALEFMLQQCDSLGTLLKQIKRGENPKPYDRWNAHRLAFESAAGIGGEYVKCSYCEGRVFQETETGNVDHYRPKKKVSALHSPVDPQPESDERAENSTRVVSERGYWFLAYDWDNWIYTCGKCNRAKSAIFNVEDEHKGAWKSEQNSLEEEKPLLLNPFDDNPDEHFAYEDGVVLPRNGSQRAAYTITTLKLHREKLAVARKRTWMELSSKLRAFNAAEFGTESMQIALKELRGMAGEAQPFTGMVRLRIVEALGTTWAGFLEICESEGV